MMVARDNCTLRVHGYRATRSLTTGRQNASLVHNALRVERLLLTGVQVCGIYMLTLARFYDYRIFV